MGKPKTEKDRRLKDFQKYKRHQSQIVKTWLFNKGIEIGDGNNPEETVKKLEESGIMNDPGFREITEKIKMAKDRLL